MDTDVPAPHDPRKYGILFDLGGIAGEPLPYHLFPTRGRNALTEGGLETWGDLAGWSPAEILDLPAMGVGTVEAVNVLVAEYAGARVEPERPLVDRGFWGVLDAAADRLGPIARDTLRRRVLPAAERATLDEIGGAHGVSRERVRQLEASGSGRLVGLGQEDPELSRAVQRVRAHLGGVVRFDDAEQGVTEAVGTGAPMEVWLLLVAAGYRRLDEHIVTAEALQAFEQAAAEADADTTLERLVLHALARCRMEPLTALELAGARAEKLLPALTQSAEGIEQRTIELLQGAGGPLPISAIANLLERDQRTASNVVTTSPALVRTGPGQAGLADRDGPAYRTVREEITSLLERDGPLSRTEIVVALTDMFPLKGSTISTALSSSAFIRDSGGAYRLRTGVDPTPVASTSDISTTSRAYLADGDLVWRISVDGEMLRGSGRGISNPLARALGADPSSNAAYTGEHGPVHIRWEDRVQPLRSSVRLYAQEASCREGDWLLLHFCREQREVTAARLPAALPSLPEAMGLPADATVTEIAGAIGLPLDSSTDEVIAQLQRRGEEELLDLGWP